MTILAFLTILSSLVWNLHGQESMDVFRLPGTTKPESYDLLIVPIMNGQDSCYSGDVKIVILPIERTDIITLNVKDVIITDVNFSELDSQSIKEIKIVEKTYVPKNEQFIIKLNAFIIPDKRYLLKMSFGGSIRTDENGFYMSSYVENKIVKYVHIGRI